MHTIGFLVQMSIGLNPSSSHAGSYTPSFLRTLEQELKSIGFSNCLALLLVIGPAISSGVSFEDE
jgi:hypothetical protein